MGNEKKYFLCPQCELNYVENEGELCPPCKRRVRTVRVISKDNFYNGEYRLTVCHTCHTQLDSREDKKCPKCHWMICPTCGSCGCNRFKNFMPK